MKNVPFSFESETSLGAIPFYFANCSDVWHDTLGSGVFGNFFPLDALGGISVCLGGVKAHFTTTEAAYQAMKVWHARTHMLCDTD